MSKLGIFLKRSGEPLLWLIFIALSLVALGDHSPDNIVAITGLFLLAALGVRATRVTEITGEAANEAP